MSQEVKTGQEGLRIWMPLLFAIVLMGGMLIGMRLNSAGPSVVLQSSDLAGELSALGQGRIEEIIRYIEAKYVDSVNREELVRKAIAMVLEELDPHSTYIPVEDLREINEQLEGNFDGIGIEFIVLDDTIVVVSPLAGGPSEAVGIQAGDKIVMINDSTVAGVDVSNTDIIDMLRGEQGTQVEVGIRRMNEPKLLTFTITRDKIPMHSVDVAYMLDEQTGYIKINRFSATTYDEFIEGLRKLVEEHGMKDLVIDLRHNPGGYLQQATNLLSQLFRDRGKLLVYTEGRTVSRTDYETNGRAFYDIGDIVVLIDEGSASASEIVAGAIQDHDRGVVIGRRSFGKGLVQEQYPLRDGSALRLTVARYYTPSGRSIQKPYEDREAYNDEMVERLNNGELSGIHRMPLNDTTKYYTNNGHVVYGGGGIVPDIFIPLDTFLISDAYAEWRQQVPNFIFRYVTEHPKEFSRYKLADFARQYRLGDNLYNAFIAYVREQTEQDEKALPAPSGRSREEIRRFLRARLGKQLFGDLGFYTIWNQDDEMVDKAIEVLRLPNPLTAARED